MQRIAREQAHKMVLKDGELGEKCSARRPEKSLSRKIQVNKLRDGEGRATQMVSKIFIQKRSEEEPK